MEKSNSYFTMLVAFSFSVLTLKIVTKNVYNQKYVPKITNSITKPVFDTYYKLAYTGVNYAEKR